MNKISLNEPTCESCRVFGYLEYAAYILRDIDVLFKYNCFEKAKFKLLLYRGKQKARDELCNVIINEGKSTIKVREKRRTRKRKRRSTRTKKERK